MVSLVRYKCRKSPGFYQNVPFSRIFFLIFWILPNLPDFFPNTSPKTKSATAKSLKSYNKQNNIRGGSSLGPLQHLRKRTLRHELTAEAVNS